MSSLETKIAVMYLQLEKYSLCNISLVCFDYWHWCKYVQYDAPNNIQRMQFGKYIDDVGQSFGNATKFESYYTGTFLK